ncbi:WYL domain-containing protein [Paenibacillus rhizovicinus]|uniref:WYL domain-containing protein n=1 Tax=Paenibacillus rhizovicinus TaxID=2704463 RepID=A0A6C0NZG9_9BACL|nr:WYL domain-containing protein [Paenibacillus rhizovicinus]QHW31660.1 WYL domain-containing protein [Paenibacillus rhizovicinus]
MSNLHRIRWFDSQLREGNYPNSSTLAAQFEISKRQAQRDIEYLACSLSAPLLYVAKYRGYCYEDKTYALPLLYMTEEEQKILNYLARRYREYNYDGAPAVNRIANLLDRFAPNDAQTDFRLPVFDMNPTLIDTTERLSDAISRQLAVTLVYRESADAEPLTVWPMKLFARTNCDYLAAYSATQRKRRTLRLDCIVSMTVTKDRFDASGLEELEWNSGGSEGSTKKPFTAKLKLPESASGSAWNGYRMRSTAEPLVYLLEFHDTDAFLQQLWTSESAWVTLLAPKWLIDKLERKCSAILKQLTPTNER